MHGEQPSFNFEKTPEEPLAEPEQEPGPELHEQDECPNCGNIIESDSPGCYACRKNKAKLAYQEQQGQKPKQRNKKSRRR